MARMGQRNYNKASSLNIWVMPGFYDGKILGEEEFGRKSFAYVNFKMPVQQPRGNAMERVGI